MAATMIGQHERTQPGYRDNLTPWQQEALFELWNRFFRLCEVPAGSPAIDSPAHDGAAGSPSNNAAASSSRNPNSLTHTISTSDEAYGAARSNANRRSASSSGGMSIPAEGLPPKDDQVKAQVQGQQEAKEMRKFLEKYGGQRLRKIFWEMVKGEHPDAIMLRLLRARKWNVDRAVAVLASTAAWRVENNVAEVVKGAELTLTSTRGGLNLLRNGVSYMFGSAATGEPVYVIEVGRHFSASQTQDELKRGLILLQETLGALMPPPVERKIVIFNMNEFGIRNMDFWAVFFMVKTMESFYVETLARVYVHGAPWVFKPIWSILKPLLDPVVRDKIRLTYDLKELEEYIPRDHLCKDSMKGDMDWKFEFSVPQPAENDLQKDIETREALQEDYYATCFDLERATRAVARVLAQSTAQPYNRHRPAPHQDIDDDTGSMVGGTEYDEPQELIVLKAKRDVLATKLRVAWLKLRPYIVGKTMADRWDAVRPDGTIVWNYKKMDGTVETQILGEATGLPALERNLAAIKEAQQSSSTDDVPSTLPTESTHQSRARRQTRKNDKTASAMAVKAAAAVIPPAELDGNGDARTSEKAAAIAPPIAGSGETNSLGVTTDPNLLRAGTTQSQLLSIGSDNSPLSNEPASSSLLGSSRSTVHADLQGGGSGVSARRSDGSEAALTPATSASLEKSPVGNLTKLSETHEGVAVNPSTTTTTTTGMAETEGGIIESDVPIHPLLRERLESVSLENSDEGEDAKNK